MLVLKLLMLLVASKKFYSEDVQTTVSFCKVGESPLNLSVKTVSSTSLELTWNHREASNLSSYIVYFNKLNKTVGSDYTTYVAQNLSPNTSYSFCVCANYLEKKEECSNAKGTTFEYIPESVNFLNVNSVSKKSVCLSWMKPNITNGIVSYYVFYKSEMFPNDTHALSTQNPSLCVESLEEFVMYDFHVQPFTSAGNGTMSNISSRTLPSETDGAPLNLKVISKSSTSIYLTWDPPELLLQNGIIESYNVTYNSSLTDLVEVKTPSTFYVATNLSKYTNYTFLVYPCNQVGKGLVGAAGESTTQEDVPESVNFLNVNSVSKKSVCLSWMKPNITNGIVSYYVFYKSEMFPNDTHALSTQNPSLCVESLEEFVMYDFHVQPFTSAGNGTMSNISSRTLPSEPDGAPLNLKVISKSSTSIYLTWDPPELLLQNGIIESYNVTYNSSLTDLVEVKTPSTFYVATNLSKYTNYTFLVYPCNQVGKGLVGAAGESTTQEDVPESVNFLNVNSVSKKSVCLSWMKPNITNGIVSYYVFYKSEMFPNDTHALSTQNPSLCVESLEEFVMYDFHVQPFTSAGNGTMSNISSRTLPSEPDGAPLNLKVISKSSTSIYLTWDPPELLLQNGIIESYNVTYNSSLTDLVEVKTPSTFYVATNLSKYTNYTFLVYPCNQVGKGLVGAAGESTTQEDVPESVNFLNVNSVSKKSVCLSWMKPNITNGIVSYYVFYKSEMFPNDTHALSTQNPSLCVESLEEFVMYDFHVQPFTSAGNGTMSNISSRTLPSEPDGAPLNLKVISKSSTSIYLTWDPPELLLQNGIIESYNVTYNSSLTDLVEVKTPSTFYVATNLSKYTNYTFLVYPCNQVGKGLVGAAGESTTQEDVPESVNFLNVNSVSKKSVCLSWMKPNITNGIVSYYVFYKSEMFPNDTHALSTQNPSLCVESLEEFVMYDFHVQPFTSAGNGTMSNISSRTLPSEPDGAPLNLKVISKSSTSIYLTWDPPELLLQNGIIESYNVTYNSSLTDLVEVKTPSTFYVATNLSKYTNYTFLVYPCNQVGKGLVGAAGESTTQEDVPDEPDSIFCFNGREGSKHFIFLNWTKPIFENGILLNYALYRNNNLVLRNLNKSFIDKEELKPYTKYNYNLAASTKVGYGKNKSISCRTQEDKPSEVVNLSATNITNSSLCLEWLEPEHPNGEVIYSIKCSTLKEKTKNLYFCLSNLYAYTSYQVFVSACTHGGELCSEKQNINVTTDFTAPSKYPEIISQSKPNPSSINLIWDPPAESAENGPCIYYVVKYWAVNINETKVNVTNTEVTLTSLKFYTNYTITLCACNEKGCGPIWTTHEETGEGIPGPPSLLGSYENSTSDTNIWININWKMPEQPNGKLLGFRLEYIPSFSRNRIEKILKELHNVLEYKITGLEPYTLYNVTLAARTSVGVGEYDFKQYHTRSAVPYGPPTLTEVNKTSTTIELRWMPPEKPNGKILKYRISNSFNEIKIGEYETESLFFEFKNLNPYTEYSIGISCVSEGGQGPYAINKVRTSETIPPLPPTVSPPSELPTSTTITIRISQGSNENGKISYYLIVVIETINGRPNKKPKDYSISDLKTYEEYIAFRKPDSFVPYIAANISSDKFPKDGTFVLGSERKNLVRKRRSAAKVYQNGPLSSGRSYCVFQRTHVNQDLYVSSEDWDGPYKTEVAVVNIPKEGGNGGKIAGGIIGVLIALIFGGALYYFKFRNKDENKIDSSNIKPIVKGSFNKGFDPDNLDPYTPSGLPIKVSNFPAYVRNLSKDGKYLFAEEFKLIQQGKGVSSYLYEHSNHPINREKNRYNNIVAYDHTRVLLRPRDDIPESDYINANYIDGYMGHGYIATQGPLEQTCQDFWRMCWEQNVNTIVMLTQLVEQGKNKCHKYWPDVGSTCYDMMQITLTESTCLPSYIVRTFSVLHDEYPGQERFIKQFAFNSWSDHGISNPQSLLTFIRHVNQSIANSDGPSGPVVVHCSAGVGRTGTYIVLDVNLKQIEAEGKVEIFKYLQHIRSQRNYMVQTEGQYIFIHDTLLEHIIFGVTEVQVQDLRNHVKKMLQTSTGSTETRIDKEFHKLNLFDPSNTKTIKAASETCNRNKNRYYNVLPYDDTRVCLKPMPGVAGSDYINASFINGYTQEKQFIASQAPLPQTIVSFWRMVWEYDCRTIVCLAQETEGGKVKIHRYWPSIEGAMHGTLMIEHASQNLIGDFIVREFKVTHTTEGHSRTIKHFQYVTWPDNSHPESGSGIVDMIGRVQKWNQQNGTGPIVVHCSNGVGRTGVFIALFNVIDRVRVEGVVDIFQTVRELRSQRPAMVQTKDQYLFCFLAFQDFLASFDIYQTFL
ncbi:phosphatidylinositol phosphatase PTPRQ isoform X2 [Hydra vulgaris]|uniref:Phosphatidylinositol phosphatase PTPRQ isoform X2 n=1 Tax=Hydra vulgaris TaxID=6087 RepID=A0ABM4CXC1_HYDVU